MLKRRYPNVTLIWSASDVMAQGVIRSRREHSAKMLVSTSPNQRLVKNTKIISCLSTKTTVQKCRNQTPLPIFLKTESLFHQIFPEHPVLEDI